MFRRLDYCHEWQQPFSHIQCANIPSSVHFSIFSVSYNFYIIHILLIILSMAALMSISIQWSISYRWILQKILIIQLTSIRFTSFAIRNLWGCPHRTAFTCNLHGATSVISDASHSADHFHSCDGIECFNAGIFDPPMHQICSYHGGGAANVNQSSNPYPSNEDVNFRCHHLSCSGVSTGAHEPFHSFPWQFLAMYLNMLHLLHLHHQVLLTVSTKMCSATLVVLNECPLTASLFISSRYCWHLLRLQGANCKFIILLWKKADWHPSFRIHSFAATLLRSGWERG